MSRTTTTNGRSLENTILLSLRGADRTSGELAEIAPRYGAYIYFLRKRGFKIGVKRISARQCLYSLKSTVFFAE